MAADAPPPPTGSCGCRSKPSPYVGGGSSRDGSSRNGGGGGEGGRGEEGGGEGGNIKGSSVAAPGSLCVCVRRGCEGGRGEVARRGIARKGYAGYHP